ncbi:MAG: DUF465 domain-containing protein [Betaproteobacteria bacterium]|nr:DUF465 domain-containing protein [Betaproteobacteria bacterium]
MNVDHHDLHHEFPEYAATIHALKQDDHHFGKLYAEYNELTAAIEDLEIKDSPVADSLLEDMKKLRLRLKDELYAMLVAHKV